MTRLLLTSLVAGALAVAGCGGSDDVSPPPALAVAPAATNTPTVAPAVATPDAPESAPTAAPTAEARTDPTAVKGRRKATRRTLRRHQVATRPARLAAPKSRPGMRPLTGAVKKGRQRRLTAPGGMSPVTSSEQAPSTPVTEDGTGGMSVVTGAPGS